MTEQALGDYEELPPRHAKAYADLRGTILEAARAYAADVTAGTFPAAEQTVRMDEAVLDEILGRGSPDRPTGTIPVGGIPLDRDL